MGKRSVSESARYAILHVLLNAVLTENWRMQRRKPQQLHLVCTGRRSVVSGSSTMHL
ncbi:hypothetical protein JG687_00017022 [Phytophthora cactorum]|uniref:Uncharacterized protein n=1 Tax=Phytophthora cactorum TaxID=29920 RepID=A0A8T1TPC7_9STRA|nr:hypothetical protein JG687_00017022 [Phytophthora cactorum]